MSLKDLNVYEKIIHFLKEGYHKIPVWILNLLAPLFWAIPADKRFGKTFIDTWNMLEKEEYHTKKEFDNLVDVKFVQLVRNCYENIPYYRRIMQELNIKPDDIQGICDLIKFPLLDKDIMQREGMNLVNRNINPKDLIVKHTSGSTGKPKALYFDKSTALREWANVLHLWKRVGYEWGSSRLVLRDIHFQAIDRGVPYQWDAMRRELCVDIHNMSDKNCEIYCRQIEKYKPEYIYGYPSALFQLCEYVGRRKLNHQFKAALLVSETVSDVIRNYIEKTLNVCVYTFYGHTERAVIAGECEKYTHYHIEPTYGYVEIIDENGNVIEDNREGEIVATGFTNMAMPLIRYRTGDLGQWDINTECSCGRYHKILKCVSGRTVDFFFDYEGKKVNATAIRYKLVSLYHVLEFQFVQKETGKVELHIIPDINFSIDDENKLVNLLKEDTVNKIDFKVIKCKELQRESNGKKRLVIQNVNKEV